MTVTELIGELKATIILDPLEPLDQNTTSIELNVAHDAERLNLAKDGEVIKITGLKFDPENQWGAPLPALSN